MKQSSVRVLEGFLNDSAEHLKLKTIWTSQCSLGRNNAKHNVWSTDWDSQEQQGALLCGNIDLWQASMVSKEHMGSHYVETL